MHVQTYRVDISIYKVVSDETRSQLAEIGREKEKLRSDARSFRDGNDNCTKEKRYRFFIPRNAQNAALYLAALDKI